MCPESSLLLSSATPEGTEALLDENSAASTHEPPPPPIKELPNWGLPRTAGIPTFKAEAPRPSEECLEDIVCIKICGQGEKEGRNKKVKKIEVFEVEFIMTMGLQSFPR